MKLSMVIFVFSMWTNHPSVALHDDKCKLLRESKTGISIFARKNIDKYILITTDGYIFQFPIQNLNLASKPMTLTLIGRGKEIIKEYKSLSRDIRYSSDKNDPIVHRLFFDNAKEWLVYFNTYYKDRVWNKTCYQIYALDSEGKTLDNEICLCDPGEKDEKKVWICGKEAESLFLSHGDYLTTGPNSRRTLEIKHYKKENSLCIYQYLMLPGARETQYKMLGAEPRTINCWAIKNETLTSGPPDAGLYWEKDPSGAETMKMLLIWNSNAIYGSHSRSEEGIVRLGKAASDDWAKGKHMTEEQEVRMSQFIDCRRDDGDDVTTNEVNDLTTTNGSFFHNHHLEIICVVLVALIVLVFLRSSCCSNKTMFNYDKKGEKRRRKKKKLSEKGRKHLQQPSSVVPASTTTTISQLQGTSYLSNNAASAASTVPSSNVSSLVKNQSQKRKTTKKKTRKRQSPIEKLHSLITSKLNTLRSMVTASVAKSRAAARKREQ